MIVAAEPLTDLRLAGASIWKPREHVSLADWCEQYIRLSPEWEATPGRYNLRDNPFWREPLDSMADPDVRRLSIMKSTQVGGTLLLIAAQIALAILDPAPSMFVGPDELYTIELRDRIYATAMESPHARDRVPAMRHWNTRHIDLGGARSYLAWVGSPQRLRGRPCKRVFRSECDVYRQHSKRGGNVMRASGERVKRFIDHLIYDESSPDGEDSIIAEAYDLGHRAKWLCPCPVCNHWQELRFYLHRGGKLDGRGGIAGYKDDEGNHLPTDEARANAHYVCAGGCRIEQHQKNDMVRDGRWVAEGQTLKPNGEVMGPPSRGRRHLSYHIWSLMSPTISIGDVAGAYLDHMVDSTLKDFHQNWCGRRHYSKKQLPEWHELGKRLQLPYARSVVPTPVWFLTAGVDVQSDGVYYVVRGWSDRATSYLIDHGYLQRYITADEKPAAEDVNSFFDTDLAQLTAAVYNRAFRMVDGIKNPLGKLELRPRMICVDSQHRTREVHALAQSLGDTRLVAIRGDHKTKPSERFRQSLVERPHRDGPAYATPRPLWNIFTTHYKEAIADKYAVSAGAPGSFNFHANIVQSSADYLRQLTNERPQVQIDATTGREKTIWTLRKSAWGNHYGDCEVYAFAAAEILLHNLGVTWDASQWKPASTEPLRPRNQTPLAAAREDQLL